MAQRTLNTPREQTHQRIADALEDIVDKMVDTSSASNVNYDNAQSGLSANKVQGAVDELASEKADKSTTLAGYGITDAYTKAEVYTQSEVNNIVSTLETNIDWKEAVNTYSDIATTYPNPQDGWTVNVKDTDYTYRYNGSEWVAISANAIPEATTSVKGLMTPTQVSKLNGIEAGAQVNTVTSVAGKTGAVTLTKSDVGLGNVDNTSDLDKPISTAVQTALNDKVDKVQGKGLSTNDYTNEEKQKNADNASAIEDIQEDISQSLTATGNPLTIQASESNLVECVAEVEAVQDLHGYDHPWVGGAGKNLLPMTVANIKAGSTSGTWNGNEYTHLYGVKFTILTDNDSNVIGININGTPTDDIKFDLGNTNFYANNSYILNGATTNNAGVRLSVMGIGSDTGSGFIYNPTSDDLDRRVIIYITGRSAINNMVVYPMIRLSTETDSSFAPYTNICPISGRSEVAINRVGKNLLQPQTTRNIKFGGSASTGYTLVQPTSTSLLMCGEVKVEGLQSIYLSGDLSALSNSTFRYTFTSEYPNVGVETFNSGAVGTNNAITVPSNAKWLVWGSGKTETQVSDEGGYTKLSNTAMVNIGTSAIPYQPYKGKTYTIQLGDTIYGGELDVLTGKLRVTHGYAEFDGSDDESLNYMSDALVITNVSPLEKGGTLPISNQYKSQVISSWTQLEDFSFSFHPSEGDMLRVKDSRNTSLADWKTYLASNTLQVCYELATPYTIQLTPQQIRLLKGTNNISCNTGDLSIKYYPDNVLGQLKGDIEDEIDAVVNRIKGVKTMQISGAAVSTDGSIMFTNLIGSIIVGTSISNDANSNKCVGIPYSMGSVPALKIMNESTMAVLPNITISGILYYIEL